MGIKKFKPTSPGVRSMTVLTNEDLTQKKPERSLVEKRENRAGRNNQGRITSWHRGGAHKRKYRVIDFRRNKKDVPAKVAAIEYDPNRSARSRWGRWSTTWSSRWARGGSWQGRRATSSRFSRRRGSTPTCASGPGGGGSGGAAGSAGGRRYGAWP